MNEQARFACRFAVRAGYVFVGLTSLGAMAFAGEISLLHTQLEVSSQGLIINGGVYRMRFAMSELLLGQARIVDLDQKPELRPLLKVYGVGLPWYHSGWFRLKDGQRAVVALTRSRIAVYLPTTRNQAILVSPDDPEAFLRALQRPGSQSRVFVVKNAH